MLEPSNGFDKILSALFYGVSSFAVIFINKIVLTSYGFPHFVFLAAVQFLATTFVLTSLVILKRLDIPGNIKTIVIWSGISHKISSSTEYQYIFGDSANISHVPGECCVWSW